MEVPEAYENLPVLVNSIPLIIKFIMLFILCMATYLSRMHYILMIY